MARRDLTTGQISELINLNKANPNGIGAEVQELIARLTSGGVAGKSDDLRIIQAKVYWDRKFVVASQYRSFNNYLASIPVIPESLLADNADFELLTLVDPRLGHVRCTNILGLMFTKYDYTNYTVVPYDERHAMPTLPYWVRAHDGKRNLNRKPSVIRAECSAGKTFVGTFDVGLAIVIQHGKREHVMNLTGSVHRDSGSGCVCLYPSALNIFRNDYEDTFNGSVVFIRE